MQFRMLTNDVIRGVFRMIVHPIICQINLSIASIFCKKYPTIYYIKSILLKLITISIKFNINIIKLII